MTMEQEDYNGLEKSMRIRVLVDVRLPLKTDVNLRLWEGDICKVKVMYENLPNICFNCGRLGDGIRDYVDSSANPKKPKYGIRLRAFPWRSVKNFDKEMSGEDAVTKCMESKVPVELEAINDVVSLLNKVSFDDNLECKEDDSGGTVSEACPKDNVHDVNRRTHVSSHPGSFDDDFNKNPIVLISGVTEIFQNHDEGSKQHRKIGIKLLGILEVLSLWLKSQCTWVIKEVARMIPTTRSRWR